MGLVLVMFSACHNHQHEDAHAGHSHNTKLQLTGYNDLYEVYAEADPFAVGKKSAVLLHLTGLNDFKPVESGTVTLSLIVGTQGIRQTLEAPSEKGIYHFELQPETVGDGNLQVDVQMEKGKSRLSIPVVKVYADAHTAEHTAEDEAVVHPNAIAFSKEQSWKIDFATALPAVESFGQVIKTTAQVLSSQGDETVIVARTSGIVLFSGNAIVEGKDITSGQELFTVSGSGMAENNVNVRLTEAQSTYRKAEADYKRAQELVREKIVSDKDFLQIQGEYETAKAVYDNLYKNFSGNGQRVSSPMAGYIRQLFVGNGQYVEAGQPLVSVSKNKTLLLKADVQVKYAPLLPLIASANIRSMDKQVTWSLEDLNGRVLSFGKSVNDDNYLIPVTFQVDNKAGFIPGGFVEVFIRTRSDQAVMTIPNTALTEEQGVFFVYVQLTPESFEKREVNIGMTDGLRTEVLSGLNRNERVVTKGSISVKLAQSSGALDPHAGHVH